MDKFLFIFLMCSLAGVLLVSPDSAFGQSACANVPLGGNYTLPANCFFSGTVNGVDNGTLTIPANRTLTIGSPDYQNQTIVWGNGITITKPRSQAAITVCKSGCGTTVSSKKGRIYMVDQDEDGFSPSATQYAGSGTNRRYRSLMESATRLDAEDNNNTVFPGEPCTNGCKINSDAGTCVTTADTGWGANTYGCIGASKRCISGTCRTCGGLIASDGCGGCAGQGGNGCWYTSAATPAVSCTTICSTRGCVQAAWHDGPDFAAAKAVSGHPCPGLVKSTSWVANDYDNMPLIVCYPSWGVAYIYDGPECSQDCAGYAEADGMGRGYRLCVCNY